MLNNVVLMGRITHDLEVKYTENEKSYLKFRIAVQRDKDHSDFFNCVSWNKTADMIYQYFGKGRLIALEGKLQNNEWETKEGQKRRDVELWVNRFYFTGEKKGDNQPETQEVIDFETDGDLPF